jgi:hypothetical protein
MNRRDLLKSALIPLVPAVAVASVTPTTAPKAKKKREPIPYLPKFWATHASTIIDTIIGGVITREEMEFDGRGVTCNCRDYNGNYPVAVESFHSATLIGPEEIRNEYAALPLIQTMARTVGERLRERSGSDGHIVSYFSPIGRAKEPFWQGARVWLNDLLVHCTVFDCVGHPTAPEPRKQFLLAVEVMAAVFPRRQ